MSVYTVFKDRVINKGYDHDGYYGWQCLTGEYLVKLSDGSYKQVKDISVGDILSTGNSVLSNEPKTTYLYWLKTSQGIFKVTEDHKVFTTLSEYKSVKDLTKKDSIVLDTSDNKEVKYNLTSDELKFFGFWLGDGSINYRWKNTTSPTVFVTVGTLPKVDYINNLKVKTTTHKHSKGKADVFNLVVKEHKELQRVIVDFKDKELVDVFTKNQYQHIIEGYLMADGYNKKDSSSNVVSSTNKQLLVTIQHGCHLNGWSAVLGKKINRKETNFSKNPKPIWNLSVNKEKLLINKFISLTDIDEEGTVYVLNTDGNHSYYADNQLHHNCWDGFVEWCKENDIPQINTKPISQGGTGYVQDLWEFRKTNGMLNYFDEVEIMEQGDVAIFKKHPWTPDSHVAIFDSDIDGKYGYFLGQNQGSTITHPQGGSAFNLIKLPYEATYPTAFRIKSKKTTGGVNVGQKTVNGDVYSSLITQARPEVFWSGGTRPLSAIKYIVIHGTATTNIVGAYSTWLKSRSNMTSANYLVTPNDIMGCVGENYVAWHSGGTGAITNYNSIGVEHINSSIGNINDASTYYFDTKTIDNGAKLVAELCKRLGIVPSAKTIVPHRAVSATACVPVDTTELLTENGWKLLRDIDLGEKVASYRLDGTIIFSEVYNVVEPYKADTWTIRDVEMTSDHRMVWKRQGANSYNISQAKDMMSNKGTLIIPNAGNFSGKGIDLTDREIELVVALQADGHYMKSSNGKFFGVEFHVSKDRKVNKLTDILDDLNIKYSHTVQKNLTHKFRIYDKNFDREYKGFLNNKSFTFKLLEMNERQFEVFYDALLDYDGCRSGNDYSSHDSINIDVVQALAGIHNVGTRSNKERTRLYFGKDYRSVPSTGKLSTTAKRSQQKLVGCVSVDTGMVLIRQHGRTTVVGNCPQTLDMNDYINRVQYYYNGTKQVTKSAPVRKVSTSSAYKVYKADEVKFISGCYQIKCNDLAPTQFTWIENGIPVAMVNWVNKDGSNITDGKDKDFKAGMYFTFAGDEVYISDTGQGGYNYNYYWRKFTFGQFGAVWLSAWNKNHLVKGKK